MAALFLTVRWAGAELQGFAIMLFDSLPRLTDRGAGDLAGA